MNEATTVSRAGWMLTLAALLVGCGERAGTETPPPAGYGESCDSKVCESGLCVAAAAGTVCSQSCKSTPCPSGDPCRDVGGELICEPGGKLAPDAGATDSGPKPDGSIAPTPDRGVSGRAGNWTGRYGSGSAGFSFVVDADGNLRDFTLTTDGGSCGSGVDYEVTFAGPVQVQTDATFSFKTAASPPSGPGCGSDKSCSTLNPFQGKLTSDTSASGTFKHSFFKLPACFGSSASAVSWTAAKGCAFKPKTGVSATRFCP